MDLLQRRRELNHMAYQQVLRALFASSTSDAVSSQPYKRAWRESAFEDADILIGCSGECLWQWTGTAEIYSRALSGVGRDMTRVDWGHHCTGIECAFRVEYHSWAHATMHDAHACMCACAQHTCACRSNAARTHASLTDPFAQL